MICRSGIGGVEAMTLRCCGGEALPLFGHEEEAEIFLWSLGSERSYSGWWIRESRCGEVAFVRTETVHLKRDEEAARACTRDCRPGEPVTKAKLGHVC
jgi:hypothetical protein